MPSTPRAAVIRALHPVRLKPYLDQCGGNQKHALALYQWNTELTAAVQEVLAHTEVILRNAMDRELLAWNCAEGGSPSWLLEPPASPLRGLVARKREDAVRRAVKENQRRKIEHPRHGMAVTHDDVLSQVMFGLWKELLPNHSPDAAPSNAAAGANALRNANRERLWNEALQKAFPGVVDPGGEITYWRVSHIHELRNRASHLEPILNVDIPALMGDAFSLVRSIDEDAANWVTGASRVSAVLKRRPPQAT